MQFPLPVGKGAPQEPIERLSSTWALCNGRSRLPLTQSASQAGDQLHPSASELGTQDTIYSSLRRQRSTATPSRPSSRTQIELRPTITSCKGEGSQDFHTQIPVTPSEVFCCHFFLRG